MIACRIAARLICINGRKAAGRRMPRTRLVALGDQPREFPWQRSMGNAQVPKRATRMLDAR
ncbi:hypothetical protein WK53_19640 [Burkholderia ubonensis]|uniref:Uncharacterized protein n=2 Tax=Burkholderia ubonensis TaxID=101571 RepID=A0AAW3N2V6_9BURK|nr:hypothetical protein WK53_19640 [Burkholderia ubonensis]